MVCFDRLAISPFLFLPRVVFSRRDIHLSVDDTYFSFFLARKGYTFTVTLDVLHCCFSTFRKKRVLFVLRYESSLEFYLVMEM